MGKLSGVCDSCGLRALWKYYRLIQDQTQFKKIAMRNHNTFPISFD